MSKEIKKYKWNKKQTQLLMEYQAITNTRRRNKIIEMLLPVIKQLVNYMIISYYFNNFTYQDDMQEIINRIVLSFDNIKPNTAVAYFQHIARNYCIEQLRYNNNRRYEQEEISFFSEIPTNKQPSDDLIKEQTRKQIIAVLDKKIRKCGDVFKTRRKFIIAYKNYLIANDFDDTYIRDYLVNEIGLTNGELKNVLFKTKIKLPNRGTINGKSNIDKYDYLYDDYTPIATANIISNTRDKLKKRK